MAQKTKAQLTALAEENNVDITNAKTNADIEKALTDAGVELNGTSGDDKASDDLKSQDERDAALPSAELQDEARELGIEPSSYHTEQELQERVDHVRAEKEAVGVDPSITEARKPGANDNLNTASDEDASHTQTS